MSETQSPLIFLGRQPILGREQQLIAYELLFRDGVPAANGSADITDPTQATATVITNAFTELAAHAALGRRPDAVSYTHLTLPTSDLV